MAADASRNQRTVGPRSRLELCVSTSTALASAGVDDRGRGLHERSVMPADHEVRVGAERVEAGDRRPTRRRAVRRSCCRPDRTPSAPRPRGGACVGAPAGSPAVVRPTAPGRRSCLPADESSRSPSAPSATCWRRSRSVERRASIAAKASVMRPASTSVTHDRAEDREGEAAFHEVAVSRAGSRRPTPSPAAARRPASCAAGARARRRCARRRTSRGPTRCRAAAGARARVPRSRP